LHYRETTKVVTGVAHRRTTTPAVGTSPLPLSGDGRDLLANIFPFISTIHVLDDGPQIEFEDNFFRYSLNAEQNFNIIDKTRTSKSNVK